MFQPRLFLVLILFFVAGLVQAAPPKQDTPKQNKRIQSEAGLNIPKWGVAVDAIYDSRLDHFVPGYKILNVVVTNRGPTNIALDPNKDRWEIKDNLDKSHTAINHLRMIDEKLWDRLPEELKKKLEYPSTVRMGYSAQIDLFFPDKVELTSFREIEWRSSHFKKEFNIYTGSEKNIEPNEKEVKIDTPANKQSLEKYETLPN